MFEKGHFETKVVTDWCKFMGERGKCFLCFHEGKGDQNSIAGSTYIIMICNDIKAVNPVDKTCLNKMIF